MHLLLIGTSHHTAKLAFREALAFSERESADVLCKLAADPELEEVLLLSTCNRTELLVRHNCPSPDVPRLAARLSARLCEEKGVSIPKPDRFYSYYDLDAVRHVFRIAAGLDSMIVGEPQILGQLKDAYRAACRAASEGFLLNKLLHMAFRVGKRARSETGIGIGAVSMGSVAVKLINEHAAFSGDPRILILGAGEIARVLGMKLYESGYRRIGVCNRDPSRAAALAAEVHGKCYPLERLADVLQTRNVLISALATEAPIITPGLLDGRQAPLLILDFGVPRNVDSSVGELPNIDVKNMDALQDTVDRGHQGRQREIPEVEEIIADELNTFLRWHRSLTIKPTIVELLDKVEKIRQRELNRYVGTASPERRAEFDELSRRLVKKILHAPIRHLKETQHKDHDNSEFWVETIRKVFDLEGNVDE